jgi:hypothetical protein
LLESIGGAEKMRVNIFRQISPNDRKYSLQKNLLNREGENQSKEREEINVNVVLNFIKHQAMRSFVGGGLAPRILNPNSMEMIKP